MKGGKRAIRRQCGCAREAGLAAVNCGIERLHEAARFLRGEADSLRHSLGAARDIKIRLSYLLDEIVDRLTMALGPHMTLVPTMLKKSLKTQDAYPNPYEWAPLLHDVDRIPLALNRPISRTSRSIKEDRVALLALVAHVKRSPLDLQR